MKCSIDEVNTESLEEVLYCLRAAGYLMEGDFGPPSTLCMNAQLTPRRQINAILWDLSRLHEDKFGNPTVFFQECFLPILSEKGANGDHFSAQISAFRNSTDLKAMKLRPGEKESIVLMNLIATACAYCAQALKSEEMSENTWGFTLQANKWLGYAQGFASRGSMDGKSESSRKGGVAKNRKVNELKKWVLSEYSGKTWPSKNKASIEIAPDAIKKAREIGTTLSADRAQKTIYEWLCIAYPSLKQK